MFYYFPSNSLFSTKSLRLFTCTLTRKKRIILSLSSGWLFQKGAVVENQGYLAVSKHCDDRDA